jgi:NAD(P)H-flavin reductase
VGVVTTLLDKVPIDPKSTVALVCGPEIMIRFTARGLVDLGLPPENIRVSLERNMQCGVGLCGHCQLGPLLICRDGPVFTYAGVVADLLSQRER